MNRRLGALLGTILFAVSACSTPHPTSHPASKETLPVLPVHNAYESLRPHPLSDIVQDSAVRSAPGFSQPTEAFGYSPSWGILVPEWIPSPRPSGVGSVEYTDGLFLIDPKTGKVTKVQGFENGEQPDTGALGDGWVAWSEGTVWLGGPKFGDVFVKNLGTGQTIQAYTVPPGAHAGRDPFGLAFARGKLYWLETLNWRDGDITTAIMSYDPERRKTETILQYSARRDRKIIFWIAVAGGEIYYSVHLSANIWDTSPPGLLAVLDLKTGGAKPVLSLPHAATALTAAGDVIAFVDNYDALPNSATNPAPFPLFVYRRGAGSVERVTPPFPGPFSSPEFPSGSGRYVAWWDRPSLLLDTASGRLYAVPGMNGEVFDHMLVWWNSGRVYWVRLP